MRFRRQSQDLGIISANLDEVNTISPTRTVRQEHLCPEMQAVTKMADLTKFRQTDVGQSDDFYANYITRDGVNMLANLTNLAIFMQITS